MKHIAYVHAPNVSLVGAMTSWIRHTLGRPILTPIVAERPRVWPRRLAACFGWLVVLVLQAALILAVREVIQLAHGVIGLYLDLADLQLDLTSQYVAATSPGK